MERLRYRPRRQGALDSPPPETWSPQEIEQPATGPAAINLIWGPVTEQLAVEGMSVEEVRTLVGGALSIPAHAQALVNGYAAQAGQRLAAGDTLEFARRAGEKGGNDGVRA